MRHRLKHFYCFVFLFVLLSLLFGFTPEIRAARIQKFQLDNGLNVVLLEEHKAPVVTFQIWYKVGSRNETNGKTGLSHLTEHMMFKGTQKVGKGEFSRIVAKNGGTENAFTGNDYTAYFESFSADRIALSLELESDRMQNLLIDEKEFQMERAVVKEERRTRTDDDPYAYLIESLYAVSFLVHPYHFPIIGWMSDLDALVRDDVVQHYKRYYVPNNATIVMVGDFQSEVLIGKIREAFGKIPKGPDPSQTVSPEPKQEGERRIVVKREAQLPFVFIGFHSPNHRSPDAYALTVLSSILSHGKSSRLYRSLIYEQKIALETGAYYDSLTTDPGLFYVYATAQPGEKPEAIEKALNDEIARLQTDLVLESEMRKVKNQIEAEYIMGSDSNFFRAMKIGTAETVGAGYQFVLDYVKNIRKVTSDDVRRVARKYLRGETRNVGILLPLLPEGSAATTKKGS